MARSIIATDDFNRNTGLGANWTQLNDGWASINIVSDIYFRANFDAAPPNWGAAVWAGAGSFTNDQYSEIVLINPLASSGSDRVGVIVRASTDLAGARDYYEAYLNANHATTPTIALIKIVNGSLTTLHSAAQAVAANDKLSLEVEGTTLRVCINGVPLGGSFTQTDSDLSTGKPGISAGTSSTQHGDNWEGGNITAGGSKAPLARVRSQMMAAA